YLARPWVVRLIRDFYNRRHPEYPVRSHITQAGVGVKYGLAAEGATDAGATAAPLLRYLLFAMSWTQFIMTGIDGGDMKPPTWDIAQVRAEGPPALVDSLPNDDRFKPLATK